MGIRRVERLHALTLVWGAPWGLSLTPAPEPRLTLPVKLARQSARSCLISAETTLSVSLLATLTSITHREWRSTRVAIKLFLDPPIRSYSRWRGGDCRPLPSLWTGRATG